MRGQKKEMKERKKERKREVILPYKENKVLRD
jgi:hypothetical protein